MLTILFLALGKYFSVLPKAALASIVLSEQNSTELCCISYRQSDEVSRLVQTVEPFLLNDSTEQLIGDLQRR